MPLIYNEKSVIKKEQAEEKITFRRKKNKTGDSETEEKTGPDNSKEKKLSGPLSICL